LNFSAAPSAPTSNTSQAAVAPVQGPSWPAFGTTVPTSAFGDAGATVTSNPFIGAFQNGEQSFFEDKELPA